MSLMGFGIALLVIGGTAKMGIKSYRLIKSKQFFKDGVAQGPAQFYKGTFLNPMTRREAQLILSVREGTNSQQIKERHRKLLLLNHPDHGGSTYVATKINEAKELLLK